MIGVPASGVVRTWRSKAGIAGFNGGGIDLLAALVKQAGGEPYSREDLHTEVFKREWSTKDRGSLDNLVSWLRKKVEPDPDHPAIIKTIRGAGYLLTAEVRFV